MDLERHSECWKPTKHFSLQSLIQHQPLANHHCMVGAGSDVLGALADGRVVLKFIEVHHAEKHQEDLCVLLDPRS